MSFPYNEKVLEHFQNPRNVGKMKDPDGHATVGSPACGDMVAVYIKVDEDEGRIKDVKFESYGCASNIATGSIITEMAKGKTIDEAKGITWKDASEELGGLPKIKAHCSVLAVDGLRDAIRNYEESHGMVVDKVATTEKTIQKRLKHVMNPITGLDVIRTDLVKEIRLEGRKATIEIDLAPDHQFANNIREEIADKIETLWDIDEVEIVFLR